ncbi:unnamed protein product [Brachionus calyciflorus]|uniref:Uncharacterized protein n=1 Tax=Brachionus calyciflorus TaxID=104777 RepID=A0A813WBU6_9BILA|nr:unnamed protein product [Brachionus calyciflorus]
MRDPGEISDVKVIGNDKIISTSYDGSINLITYKDGIITHVSDNEASVNCICVLDDDTFATGSDDMTIKIRNKNTKKLKWDYKKSLNIYVYKGHESGVRCLEKIPDD